MSVTGLLLLSSLGFAITVQAQSCSKPVGGPNMSLKAEAINQNTFVDGSSVFFACNVGYISAGGSPTITCSAGSWSQLKLVCERYNCGALQDVASGTIDYPEGTEFGATAIITCNPGYTLVGKNKIRCESQGWNGRLPTCEVVTCDPPAGIKDGNFNPQLDKYDYRATVLYTCNSGFTLNGSRQSSCSEDGKFTPPPTCVFVQCKDLNIPNAEYVEGSRPPHKYLASVTYSCKPGHTMIGAATVKCEINSQWSPEIPECRKTSTPTQPTTTPTTRKTPSVSPSPTEPRDRGNGLKTGLIVGAVLLTLAIGTGASYFWGVPSFIWKKRGKRGSPVGPTLLYVKVPTR